MSDPLTALTAVADRAWLVGGAVRDRLLGRPTADYDVAVIGSVEAIARGLGRAAQGFAFELSQAFGTWRVVAHDRTWQLDLLALNGEGIEQDLARRDFTVNAIAMELGTDLYVDPFAGREDLRARRLRMVSGDAFCADPLRTLRLARLSCELGFEVEPRTLATAAASASALVGVAPERVFAELKRVVCADRALGGLDLMDVTGATAAVLPELAALRGVVQSRFHHLDVFDHTRAVLAQTIALERDPSPACQDDEQAESLLARLQTPLADDLTRGQALRFGALLHDIAKPETRAVNAQGRVTFMGHDEAGAALGAAMLGRLRASERLREYVAALTRQHLRLGFLVHAMPLTRRDVYDYLLACAPVGVEVTLLSVADRLSTRGDDSEVAIAKHRELARQLMGEALAWLADPPRPPVRGDELARALGIEPGPLVGGLLRELQAESFSGELETREQAIERARQLIDQPG
jgi:poly(A) polymerase